MFVSNLYIKSTTTAIKTYFRTGLEDTSYPTLPTRLFGAQSQYLIGRPRMCRLPGQMWGGGQREAAGATLRGELAVLAAALRTQVALAADAAHTLALAVLQVTAISIY